MAGGVARANKSSATQAGSGEWEVCDVELDEPREHEVLVRMGAAGLCHFILVSQRYELDAINKGYADLHAGRNIRGLVVFGEG